MAEPLSSRVAARTILAPAVALLLAALLILIPTAPAGAADSHSQGFGPSAEGSHHGGKTDGRVKGKHPKKLKATIRRTKYGIPHIKAKNIESLSAGFGYAYAEDNICTIANEYLTVSAKRSKYFGPDGEYYFSGNGTTYKNIDTDLYFKWVEEQGVVRKLMQQPPPFGPKRGVRQGVKGYVSGYNRYLDEVGVDNIPDPSCRGAEWVRKIRQKDAYRRFYQLGILASSGAVINGITNAKPVSPAAASEADAKRDRMLESGEGLDALQPNIGSNGYAFGKDATTNGKGLVLGNPHFPWDGGERLYQSHLTIPGKLDVQGAGLSGVPLVLIGNTRGLAWTHTVATAWRFTPFSLNLVPGDPYSYIVDGQTKKMEATKVSVPVKTDAGVSRRGTTIYSTIYGPMITDLVGIPLPWSDATGFALKDVNATNFRYLNHFFDNDRAQTVQQYDRIQRRYQGIPWVNSIAADRKGNSYYTMQGAIPNVPDELAARCNVLAPVYEILGLPVLNGSDSSCDWQSEDSGVAEGTFAPDQVPTQYRDDYVHNGNDSHWLTNPNAPLTGFDRIIGIERAERTFRTRIGLKQVEERLAGTDGLPGKGFDQKSLEQVALGNRQYLGELWREGLVSFCELAPGGQLLGSNGPVDVSGACAALEAWDLRDNLDSNGAILFRRFASILLGNFRSVPTGLQGSTTPGAQTLFLTQFDPADPVNTPRGLNVANPLVGKALADAVTNLENAGIPLDAPLRGYQFENTHGGRPIPIHGGPGGLGVFNAISAPWRPKDGGFPDIVHGSSYIMAAQFQPGGKGRCPVDVDTFLTYGQTENDKSPHSRDYTRAFSKKRWNDVPFCRGEVRRQTLSKQRIKASPRPGRRSNEG